MHRTAIVAVLLGLLGGGAAAERVAPSAGAPAGPRAHHVPVAEVEPFEDLKPSRPRLPPRRERVAKALARQRARHLAAFRAYRKRGRFAHDLDRAGEVYVWRDGDGHDDVIAALMVKDGRGELVAAVAPGMIGVRLAELGQGDVSDWMLMSGFSTDEIDRLQRPHTRPPVVREGDTSWQQDEDARLAQAYVAVESYLVSHAADGLDAATDELMLRSELAWWLVTGKKPTAPRVPPPILPRRAPRP